MELGLAGKAVVVTGGSKGIGLETAWIRTFGGPKRNRLFMAAGNSLYALHVGTRGAQRP